MSLDYLKAKEKLLTSLDKDSRQFFIKNGYILEAAYYELLNNNLKAAEELFLLIKNENVRAKWALFVISMIKGVIYEYPTYLELRCFLEIDLNIFLNHYKGEYVEKIIRYADFMFTVNPETYKFIGRVFYNAGYIEQAMFFLERAKSYFYNDPELHYLISYIYFNSKEYTKCRLYLESCLRILPAYNPAVKLLKLLDNI